MSKRQHSSDANRKEVKKRYERLPETKFRRYIASMDPDTKAKKRKYAADEKVIERRKFLNRKRNYRCRILFRLLRGGKLFDESGNQFDCLGGVVCLPDKNDYFIIDNKNNIQTKQFQDEIELSQVLPFQETEAPEDVEYKALCRKFVEGDEEVLKIITTKKVTTTIENPILPNLDYLKKKVQNRLDGIYSDSSDEE